MTDFQLKTAPEVAAVFDAYPSSVRPQMLALRQLVIDTAKGIEGITHLEETLKWGEPSYLTSIGSTLRMDWKAKSPDQYALYFKCTSRLVETFKAIFNESLDYEGKRALVFKLDAELPTEILTHCITAALTYHKVKKLPTLGI
ncbi:DUF1801 domain-containing protein [Zobellia galactanivorans]|uniref:YdhG-like domain-containing protein n=1 Tax=Zobellia galactanivorans (strain DSM 12802 / CCUG 47099 / CIP 106680 / NCIMB 13871 / Dsij) TaxID=63186 RepID=G0L8K2_ZOBGA|nr:DUF1801 domain-containing protein [Zobellia galactanivorans]CAZ97635.1 Conserved hypothetical protein [Zobellia galactanivorans]